jgi:hypothetical protein
VIFLQFLNIFPLLSLRNPFAMFSGSDFYHAHHSRRTGMDPAFSFGFIESVVVRAASMFGGVEVTGRKMVAQARKKYADKPIGSGEVVVRLIGLAGHAWPCVKTHVKTFFSIVWHITMRWLALNVIARLYTKEIRPQQDAAPQINR